MCHNNVATVSKKEKKSNLNGGWSNEISSVQLYYCNLKQITLALIFHMRYNCLQMKFCSWRPEEMSKYSLIPCYRSYYQTITVSFAKPIILSWHGSSSAINIPYPLFYNGMFSINSCEIYGLKYSLNQDWCGSFTDEVMSSCEWVCWGS